MARAHGVAEAITANAPISVRLSKQILLPCDRAPYLKEVADPGAAMVASAAGEEMKEGTTAFAQKRPARFSSPPSG
jgi:1,4-dihydroxy-2-naphthoyl-CoA synthase